MGYLITDSQTDGNVRQTDRSTKEKTDGRTESKTHEVKNQLYYLNSCILVSMVYSMVNPLDPVWKMTIYELMKMT